MPDEILAAMPQQIASRCQVVETVHEVRRRTFAVCGHRAGHGSDGIAIMLDRRQERDDTGFAFALEHAIDGAFAMIHNCLCGERSAVAADADETARQFAFGRLGKVDDLRDIGEIVAGKSHEVGPPFSDQTAVVGVLSTCKSIRWTA